MRPVSTFTNGQISRRRRRRRGRRSKKRRGREEREERWRATILGEQRVRFFAIFARLETGIGFRNFQRARTDSDDQSRLRRDCSWLGKEEAADSDVLRKQIEVKGESISFDESPVSRNETPLSGNSSDSSSSSSSSFPFPELKYRSSRVERMAHRTCRFQSKCFIYIYIVYTLLYFSISNFNVFIIYEYAWRILFSIFLSYLSRETEGKLACI